MADPAGGVTMWRILDAVVHALYVPLRWVCDRYEARMLRSVPDWVDDPNVTLVEVEERFDAAWARGELAAIAVPIGYRCPHVSLTANGVNFAEVSSYCGCILQPVFANA